MSTDMTRQARRESPLAEFHAVEDGVEIAERPFLGHVNLRGDPNDPAFLAAAEGALGVALPLEPNTVASAGEVTVLWLSPDEWLVLSPTDGAEAAPGAVRDAMGDLHAAVTDLTGGQTVISIRGPRARDVLAKGSTLDLHPRVFGQGRCAQTQLGHVPVTIRQLDDSPSFDLIVRRSFANHLAEWLEDAVSEYAPEAAQDAAEEAS